MVNCRRNGESVFKKCLLVLFALQACADGLLAQAVRKDSGDDIIRLETTLIQVPVIVRTGGGRYVSDLGLSDFTLYENGIRQDIALIKTVEEPFNVVMLIDSSGSTKDQLNQIKSGAKQFVGQMREQDRVMVVSFNDSVEVLSPFTSNRDILIEAIDEIKPGEYTQVFEAVYTAVWEKLAEIEGRKAVILFSDGIDTASSEITREDTLDAVLEMEDVILYPIRYNTRPDVERRLGVSPARPSMGQEKRQSIIGELDRLYSQADDYLLELASLTGGRLERVEYLVDVGAAFSRIAEELRNQYLLGYYSSEKNVRRRRLEVRVSRSDCQVRVRPGFRVRSSN